MMNLLNTASDWLQNNHIQVPDDWLQACVEWIREENQNQGLTEETVKSQVYEQWLLSDLHELETRCLPSELVAAQKFQLSGAFALQIDSIVDVGVSFYSQSQKLQGKENANVHVTADEPTQKPWEQKPSRMLMMKLTDGSQCVQGMEYRPISFLSPQTPPGTKVIVHGSVLCRHGILMLTEANVKFLGGEVDTLVEANTVINTLQSAMETSTENANKEHKKTFPGTAIKRNKTPDKTGSQRSTQSAGRGGMLENQSMTRGFPGNQSSGKLKMELKTQPSQQNRPAANRGNEDYADYYDAFMDELDDDFIKDIDVKLETTSQLPDQHRHQNPPAVKSNQPSLKTTSIVKPITARPTPQLSRSNSHMSRSLSNSNHDDDLAHMFDDDMDFPPMDEDFTEVSANQKNGNNSNKIGFGQRGNQTSQSGHGSTFPANSRLPTHSRVNNPQPTVGTNVNVYENMDITINMSNNGITDMQIRARAPAQAPNSNNNSNRLQNNTSRTGNSFCNNSNSIQNNNVSVPINNAGNNSTRVQNTSSSTIQSRNSANISEVNIGAIKTERPVECGNGSNISGKRAHSSSIPESESLSKILKLKEQQAEFVKATPGPDIETEYPFTYLSTVMSRTPTPQPTYHTVKAYISTLTGKLTSVNNKWSLSCKINDGTKAVDVDLSSQVLTQMIGFSPTEANEMKLRVKRDPKVKEILTEGIQQCQQKLIELMCLLELEISSSHPRPVIVATKQLTKHHIGLLHNRVLAKLNV